MTTRPGPRRLSYRLTLATLASASVLVVSGGVAMAQSRALPRSGASLRPLVAVTPAARLPLGAHVVGPLPAATRLHVAVALRLPDQAALTRFIDEVSSRRSSSFGRYLRRGEFAKRFGPSTAAVATVVATLRRDGLAVTGVSANRLLIGVAGSAATMESAFHTGLERVRLASGQDAQATTSAVRLPRAIAPHVAAIVGLDRLVREHALLAPPRDHAVKPSAARLAPRASGGPASCPAALSQEASGALTDTQVAASYGLDPLYGASDLASTQTVDIFELEPFALSDVKTFDECYFGADHTGQIALTSVDGGAGTGPGVGEASLDVEDVSGIAPGAHIHVFTGPNTNDPFGSLDTWNTIAMADDANQISTSWGLCETALQEGAPGVQQVEDEIFEQTAAQGQTVFAAAGDNGSDDCSYNSGTPVAADLSVDDPGSQPYVTSVGGTTILDPTEPPVESVWNNGNDGGAGGGGISETWAMAPWQESVAVPQTADTQACSNDPNGDPDNFHVSGIGTNLPGGTSCREVPDVAALADPQTGITVVNSGQWFPVGGTSSSTPLWAAMLAEINGSSACSGLSHGVGFADPLLYQIASGSAVDYANAFNDITVGNNDNLGVGGAVDWPATSGYDLASGLGSPRVTDAGGAGGLDSQLCALAAGSETTPPPTVTALSSSAGTYNGGGTLTITGTDFGSDTGTVWFGEVDANVNTWTPTSISVQIPGISPPQSSQNGIIGEGVDVIVTTAGPPQESSAPGPDAVYHYDPTSHTGVRPVVDYVSSSTGPTAGGGVVDVVGSGFTGTTGVKFGDVTAATYTVLSDDELQVTVPASDGACAVPSTQGDCAVAVAVTNANGTSPAAAILPAYQGPVVFAPDGSFTAPNGCGCETVPAPDEYDYASAPTVSSVTPSYVSENGTTQLTIDGTGFNFLDFEYANVGTAGVNANQTGLLDGVTPTQLTFTVPSYVQQTIEPVTEAVSVQTSGGLSNTTTAAYAGVPVLKYLSTHLVAQPDPGQLSVTGSGLSDVTSVVFQAQGQLNFLSSTSTTISNQTDTSLTVAIPQSFAYATDVLLCSATGCTSPRPAVDTLTFAYPGRPVVSSSSPAAGPAHGSTTVTIEGQLDSEVTAVDFGSAPATIVTQPMLSASGSITVLAPPGTAGSKVDVTITTNGGALVGAPRSAVTTTATFTYVRSSPSAPRAVTAHAGVGSAMARWAAPVSTGGDPITGYAVVATATGHASVSVHTSAAARSVNVLKLAPKVAWTITVYAVNAVGRGLGAPAAPVVPRA